MTVWSRALKSQWHLVQNPPSKKLTMLALIFNSGEEPTVIEHLKNPPDRVTLEQLIEAMGMPVRDMLRQKGTHYIDLGLNDSKGTDDQLIDFMPHHRSSSTGRSWCHRSRRACAGLRKPAGYLDQAGVGTLRHNACILSVT
jgi:arsenate reductase-like glutaredoxin family protein